MRLWDRSPLLFITESHPRYKLAELSQGDIILAECIGKSINSILTSSNIYSFPHCFVTFLTTKQHNFLKRYLASTRHQRRLEQMSCRAVWRVDRHPCSCRGSTFMLPMTVVSQTGAIIHHKATQRRLRVNYRESLDQLLLVMVRQISFDTITPSHWMNQ